MTKKNEQKDNKMKNIKNQWFLLPLSVSMLLTPQLKAVDFPLSEGEECRHLVVNSTMNLPSFYNKENPLKCDSIEFKEDSVLIFNSDVEIITQNLKGNPNFQSNLYPVKERMNFGSRFLNRLDHTIAIIKTTAGTGHHGHNGGNGRNASCKIKWGVPKCHGTTPGAPGGHGGRGQDGRPGASGQNGRDGRDGYSFTLTTYQIENLKKLTVITNGENGQKGQDGQQGSRGGNGGNGGQGGVGGSGKYGHSSSHGGRGGNAGNGGNGGSGGNGGAGGNGGDGGAIEITFQSSAITQATLNEVEFDLSSYGGKGGAGGVAGRGGQPGSPGSPGRGGPGGDGRWFESSGAGGLGGHPGSAGSPGRPGTSGEAGQNGVNGEVTKPAIWIEIDGNYFNYFEL